MLLVEWNDPGEAGGGTRYGLTGADMATVRVLAEYGVHHVYTTALNRCANEHGDGDGRDRGWAELGTATTLCTRSHAMRWRIEETHHPGELGVSCPKDQSGLHTPFQKDVLVVATCLLFAVCMHVALSSHVPVIALTRDSR